MSIARIAGEQKCTYWLWLNCSENFASDWFGNPHDIDKCLDRDAWYSGKKLKFAISLSLLIKFQVLMFVVESVCHYLEKYLLKIQIRMEKTQKLNAQPSLAIVIFQSFNYSFHLHSPPLSFSLFLRSFNGVFSILV